MKTYTSSYTTAVASSNPKNMGFAVRLYYDDEASSLRFAMQDDIFISVLTYGYLADVTFDESGFDPYSGANINAACTIRINDEYRNSTYQATSLISGKGFKNRRVQVYRYVSSYLSSASMYGNDPEFDGNISNVYYDIQNSQWVFECEHLFQHRTLPQTSVTKEDYPEAPESSIGAAIPLLYGSFVMSGTGTRADGAHGLNHVAPTICTNVTKGIYTIAEHAVHTLTTTDVAIWLDGLGAYGHGVYAWDGAANDYPDVTLTGPSILQMPVPASSGLFRVESIWLRPKLKGIYNQVSGDSDNAVDGDYNTALTVGASTRYAVKFPYGSIGSAGEFNGVSVTTDMNAFAFVKAHTGSAYSLGLRNTILASNYTGGATYSGTGYQTQPIGQATNRSDNVGTALGATVQWSWGEAGLYEYYFSVPAASSADISTFGILAKDLVVSGSMREEVRIGYNKRRNPTPFGIGPRYSTYEVRTTRTRYLPDPNAKERGLSNIFTQVTGRKFGSWIGSRNGLATTNYIPTSNYMIESILRDELLVDDAYIDETAFDADYSSAYTFAFSLNKKESSQSILRDLAFQSGCYLHRKTDGVWTLFRLPASPSSSDIDFDVKIGDVAINNVYDTPHEWVENDVRVLYNYDYAKGEYTWDTSAEDTTSKGNGATGFNATAQIEIGADFIRKSSNSGDTNFAVSLKNYRVAQWAYPHSIVEFDCLNPTYFKVEEGDVCTFNNVARNWSGIGAGSAGDYWASFSGVKTKYWLIFSRLPQLDKVSYKAIQLHTL